MPDHTMADYQYATERPKSEDVDMKDAFLPNMIVAGAGAVGLTKEDKKTK